jgi:hypothetical protein
MTLLVKLPYPLEAEDDATQGTGGAPAPDAGTDATQPDAPAVAPAGVEGERVEGEEPAPAAPAKPPADPGAGMLEAINKGLGYVKPDEKKEEQGKAPEGDDRPRNPDGTFKAAEQPKPGEKQQPKVGEQPKAKEGEQPAAPKKTIEQLTTLSEAEKKAMNAASQARFHELAGSLKEMSTKYAALEERSTELQAARENMLGVLQDTHTSSDELAGYLDFNAMLHSGEPAQWERALKLVNDQRAVILTALGREEEGVDLLKDFPDLVADVEEQKVTRERALELAASRRRETFRTQHANKERETQRTTQQQKQDLVAAQNQAITGIEKWCNAQAGEDIDYKAKEGRLLEIIDEVVKTYPPGQWLPTLKLLYGQIAAPRVAAPPNTGGPQPLRASGARGGQAKPRDMLDAINLGLGYTKS